MDSSLDKHLKNLKEGLLRLSPTGETGFEGLIGATLREISGVPFRLAGSGSQFGVDGKAAYEGDAICFEGKRYEGAVPRKEVLAKIAEISIGSNETDLWVLGATSPIKSQLADVARALGRKSGISVLILDWSEPELPPFAAALAMGSKRVEDFLKANIDNARVIKKSLAALDAIRKDPDFSSHAERIRAQLIDPTLGSALAKKANAQWLVEAFSDRKRARERFGQPLSPSEVSIATIRPRKLLLDTLKPFLAGTPDETVVCVLGGEGNGKSWVVAQSWLALVDKPLIIVMGPDDFVESAGQNDIAALLIAKLVKQTGDDATDATRQSWRRHFAGWQNSQPTNAPRLVVVIDGINQRPATDWARIIDSTAGELELLGGRLIITSRTPYFRDRIKPRLSVSIKEIKIPEWTEHERDDILLANGIRVSELQSPVAATLRNPRLLGIALELLGKAEIADMEELNVSRLLFEHIRTSERDAPVPQPASEFAHRLQSHAKQILNRIHAKQQDDLTIFEGDVSAVADGRFYQQVDNDPVRYSLGADGLTLALGLAVIDLLRTALRNGRDLDAELTAILEPIAALDDAANVILSALTVAAVDASYEQGIATALVTGFAALQNPDQGKFPAFAGLARRRPQAFMASARILALVPSQQPNVDWIQHALIQASRDHRAWSVMSAEVRSWLSAYSLSPKRGVLSHAMSDQDETVQEKLEKNRVQITEKLKNLSAAERKIFNWSHEIDGDINSLSRLAFFLLAGKPLASFADSFLQWCFSDALNTDIGTPHKEFKHLLWLNRRDWPQTRAALLKESAPLRSSDTSTTGSWALVAILRATGHGGDDEEARALVANLTKDQQHLEGWSLVEQYSAADPCDPASIKPKNVTQTAVQYQEIDVSQLRQHMGQTQQDHFLSSARPAMARFEPDAAVAKHREFADHVLSRVGFPLRQGLLELREHNALLTAVQARALITKRAEQKNLEVTSDFTERDAWIVSQYVLLLAFPFIGGDEQLAILLSDQADENILLDLMDVAKPVDQAVLSGLLDTASDAHDDRRQYILLEFIKYTFTQLSPGLIPRIAVLSHSESEAVRAQALGVIALSHEEALLREVADSDWNAANADTENGFETWYGSAALLEAARSGLMSQSDAVNRMSPLLYGRAATVLEADAVGTIAQRLDHSIRHAIGLRDDLVGPDIELLVRNHQSHEPSRYRIGDPPSQLNDAFEEMKRFSENSEAFEKRQKRNRHTFNEFKKVILDSGAGIILDCLDLKEFEAVLTAAEECADRWYALFMDVSDAKLPAVHNIVLLLAYALGKKNPDKAKALFLRSWESKPLVRIVFGEADIGLDAMAIWAADRNPLMDILRFNRLDLAGTDHALALEVLAASLNRQQELLTAYIEARLQMGQPADVARGLLVAGFSDQSEFNDKAIARFEGSAGLIGSALKAAKYAYEQNVWAHHWFKLMCQTDMPTDFWRYEVLFLKIVDGRFDLWSSNTEVDSEPFRLFGPSVKSLLRSRINRWESHRNKTLFGLDAPTPIFLDSAITDH